MFLSEIREYLFQEIGENFFQETGEYFCQEIGEYWRIIEQELDYHIK